jgi:tryptophanyl-tRNA synthetase
MAKPVILTGLRANNDLHIGNYFGGLLPIIDMAKNHSDEYDINLFIPDLHSFTTPINHDELFDTIISNARIYAAAGLPLDNDSIHIYRQSYIPAHSEMTWILDCFTGMGEMGRMTQYKDKSAKLGDDQITVGLFNYPVLMASDILLYNASYVPVGDDQSQHLEFTRDIATRMNNRFGELFTVPESVADQHKFFGRDQGLRIKDLVDPTKKMSKSDETGKGVIFLTDTPEAARKKIMSATTDNIGSINYDKENQPGISNLIEILALLRGKTPQEVAAKYKGLELYGNFKKVVADEVVEFLVNFQKNLANIDDSILLAKMESSERTMRITASETLLRVQKAVGLRK